MAKGLQYKDIVAGQSGMDREAIAAKALQLVPTGPKVSPTSGAISTDKLEAPAPIKLPSLDPNTSEASGIVAGANQTTKGIDAFIKEMTPPETETSKQYNEILGSINELLPQTANKKQDQLKAEKEANLPQLKQQLASLNAQILSSVANYEKAYQAEETRIAPMTNIVGRQAAIRRNQASEIGLLQARALGLQGQVEMAQETANRAIDLKYDSIEDTLNVKLQQLQLIEPSLNREEQRFAAALERKYNEEREALAEKKAKAKENIGLAFSANIQSQFVNKGGEFFRASDGKPYENPEDFFRDAGVASFEQAYQRGLVTDLTAERLADLDFVQQLRLEYKDAGINFNDDVDTAVNKLGQSNKYLRENAGTIGGAPEITKIGDKSYVWDSSTGSFVDATGFVEGDVSSTPKLTASQAEALAGFTGTKASAYEALTLLDSGIKTGPITGRTLQAKKQIGAADPNQLKLEQVLGLIKSSFQKAISGATVSDREVERLSAFLPSINDQEDVIRTKLNTLISESESKKRILLDTLGGGTTSEVIVDGNQVKGSIQYAKPLPYINPQTLQPVSPAPLAPTVSKISPPGSVGGQCGDWVRRVVTKMGGTYPTLGNTLKSKTAAVMKYGTSLSNGGIGSVIVTKENPTYGHVAYIVGKNAKGYIVGESNFKQSNKVSYGRTIPFNSPQIIGIINPTQRA